MLENLNEKEKIERIIEKLKNRKETIATMESCTGGALVSTITNISGASDIIKESYVTYCNEAKIKFGVPKEIIEKYTVYSIETANEMAKAASKNAKSDWGIGITGQIGRIDPNNLGKKDNEVFYALSYKSKILLCKKIYIDEKLERFQKKQVIISNIINDILKELN